MLDKDIIVCIFGFLNNDTNKTIKKLCDPYYDIQEEFCCIELYYSQNEINLIKYINLVYTYNLNEKIKYIPDILINLKRLDCSKTQVSVIPKTLIKLIELYCIDTPILEIPKELVKLQVLFCSGTLITEVPKELIKLKELGCSRTNVSKVPKEFVKLQTLYCSMSQITEIPPELVNLVYLEHFDCGTIYIPSNLKGIIMINNNYGYFMYK